MLTVATFLWRKPGYRSAFGPENLVTLASMISRHYSDRWQFAFFSDRLAEDMEACARLGIQKHCSVRGFQLWDDLAQVQNPSGSRNPSCYRRLRIFARNVGEWLGPRIVTLDLDCVITGDMRPVWNRPEDFVIWGDTNRANPYNGSMVLFSAGARPQLWEDFDEDESPALARRRGYFGSDQAWIAYCLGPREKKWTARDGVYSFRNEIAPRGGRLPPDARIVFFHGRIDPWSREAQRYQWVKENYR